MEKKITVECHDCCGTGCVSSCCGAPMDGKRCECGKFAKAQYCCEGVYEFVEGSDVEVCVCAYSPQYLKDALYNAKKQGDLKTFYGKIVEILPGDKALIKFKYKKELIEVNADDFELN